VFFSNRSPHTLELARRYLAEIQSAKSTPAEMKFCRDKDFHMRAILEEDLVLIVFCHCQPGKRLENGHV